MDRNEYKGRMKPERIEMKAVSPDYTEPEKKPVALHVALNAPTYSSGPITHAFRENGYEADAIDWQWIKFNEGIEGLHQRLIGKVQMIRPDVIFLHIQNPDIITIELIEAIKEKCPRAAIINYTFDVRDDISWYIDIAPYVEYTFFASREDVEECHKRGIYHVGVMQSSCDLDVYRRSDLISIPPIQDIVFIGANYENTNLNFPCAKERQEMVQFLSAQYGDQFGAYGAGQLINRYIQPAEEILIYNQCKIAIIQNNFHRKDYVSDRIWRAMGCGAFCLAKWFPGIEQLFLKEVHLDTWETFDELKTLIDYYLVDEKERKSIADMGHLYVTENHRWTDRVRDMLAIVDRVRTELPF